MNIYEIKDRTPEVVDVLLKIWEDSVRATHKFLSNKEIEQIREYVPQVISSVAHLIVAEDESGKMIAFMGIENQRLKMLFLLSAERGNGIGKQLLQYGMENYKFQELTVNEQNPQAVGFYRHMGFETYKRTDYDEEGNPYPLLYMKKI